MKNFKKICAVLMSAGCLLSQVNYVKAGPPRLSTAETTAELEEALKDLIETASAKTGFALPRSEDNFTQSVITALNRLRDPIRGLTSQKFSRNKCGEILKKMRNIQLDKNLTLLQLLCCWPLLPEQFVMPKEFAQDTLSKLIKNLLILVGSSAWFYEEIPTNIKGYLDKVRLKRTGSSVEGSRPAALASANASSAGSEEVVSPSIEADGAVDSRPGAPGPAAQSTVSTGYFSTKRKKPAIKCIKADVTDYPSAIKCIKAIAREHDPAFSIKAPQKLRNPMNKLLIEMKVAEDDEFFVLKSAAKIIDEDGTPLSNMLLSKDDNFFSDDIDFTNCDGLVDLFTKTIKKERADVIKTILMRYLKFNSVFLPLPGEEAEEEEVKEEEEEKKKEEEVKEEEKVGDPLAGLDIDSRYVIHRIMLPSYGKNLEQTLIDLWNGPITRSSMLTMARNLHAEFSERLESTNIATLLAQALAGVKELSLTSFSQQLSSAPPELANLTLKNMKSLFRISHEDASKEYAQYTRLNKTKFDKLISGDDWQQFICSEHWTSVICLKYLESKLTAAHTLGDLLHIHKELCSTVFGWDALYTMFCRYSKPHTASARARHQ
jgi:hypothetical protein